MELRVQPKLLHFRMALILKAKWGFFIAFLGLGSADGLASGRRRAKKGEEVVRLEVHKK